jgi:putative flavoprotein involved in K+ transport
VLVVGAGNSGAEIAVEVGPSHQTWLSGRYRRFPFGPSRSRLVSAIIGPIFRNVLTVDTPIVGRRARVAILRSGAPVERVTRQALRAAGVELVPRTEGIRDGRPLLADGRTLDVANVIWCTGFAPGVDWIDLPILDARGVPRQLRGMVPEIPGLYFIGRLFQRTFISATIGGVGADAAFIARQITTRTPTWTAEVGQRARV